MIEIEQKFLVTKNQLDQLLGQIEFIQEKVFTDIYYDTPDYSLTKDDIWLRQRDGVWELKVPLDGLEKDYITDHYEEIDDERKIGEFLQIDSINNLSQDLAVYNYRPFCELTTTRRKYKQGDFNIDVDVVKGDNFNYAILELELLIEVLADAQIAKTKILTWAKAQGLAVKSVYGKVIAYLQQERLQHFQALVDSGTIKIHPVK